MSNQEFIKEGDLVVRSASLHFFEDCLKANGLSRSDIDKPFKVDEVSNSENGTNLHLVGLSGSFSSEHFTIYKPNSHKHAELFQILADNAKVSKTPWEGFEWLDPAGNWSKSMITPSFSESVEWRYNPKKPFKAGETLVLKDPDQNDTDPKEVFLNSCNGDVWEVSFNVFGEVINVKISNEMLNELYERAEEF